MREKTREAERERERTRNKERVCVCVPKTINRRCRVREGVRECREREREYRELEK
jgi:hypothetical protein